MHYNIFTELRKLAESRWPEPIETTLLGKVRIAKDEYDKWVSIIPKHLAERAAEHGLEIFGADFKNNTYQFRLLEKPNNE